MLLNIYSATQWHVLWTRYIHPSWSSYLGGAGDWGKGVWMYSNGLFRSHSDESRKWARNSCQHSWWAPTAPGWYAQPLIFASIRFLKLWHFCHLPPESPAFWSTLQEHILSASSCQEDLAHLRHINWSSVETFEPFFLKKEKHLGTTEKKKMKERNQKPQILFCDLGLCQIGGNNLQILPQKPQVCSDSALCRLRQWSTPCLREVTESLNCTWLSSRCDRGQRRWPHTSHDLVDLELLEEWQPELASSLLNVFAPESLNKTRCPGGMHN